MHFETRLWQFTKGVRLRMVYTVLIGLVAACFGIARLVLEYVRDTGICHA